MNFSILAAQTTPEKEETLKVPLLDTLIARAQRCAPSVKARDVAAQMRHTQKELGRRDWLNYVYLTGTALVGTTYFDDVTQNATAVENTSLNRRNGLTNLGVTAKIGIGELFNRKKEDQAAELFYQQAVEEKAAEARLIKDEVILRYYKFQSSYETMKAESENYQSLNIAYETATKFFQEGNMSAEEYSTAASRRAIALKQFLQAKNEAKYYYRLLLSIACMD